MIYIIVLSLIWLIGVYLATTEVRAAPHDVDTSRVFTAEEDAWEDQYGSR